jgi:hypothetical protein
VKSSGFTSAFGDLDTLSAIWILASNDEVPLITYKGINYRLGLPEEYNVQGLIGKHRELFRPITNSTALEAWKKEMLLGRKMPIWISEISDATGRQIAIKSLFITDVFRSQFRGAASAPPSDLKIIEWGLEHIDRLRKVLTEERAERRRRASEIWIPAGSILIALLASTHSIVHPNKK